MLTPTQRALLEAARKLLQDGKEEVLFLAVRAAFNAGTTEAAVDDVAVLNDFINDDVIANIRNGDDASAWQRMCGMSRPGDATVVGERLAWIERLLKKGEANADA